MKETIIQQVLDKKIIAIVRGVYGEDCLRLAQALYDGGIELLEVTFDQRDKTQWKKTEESIALLNQRLSDKMLFGAGTVTERELVLRAKKAGAKFIVSPDVNPEVIQLATDLGLVTMPGALTPTETLTAHKAGADFVKLFPAGTMGNSYLKAIRGPVNHVKILAVGGIDETNAAEFLQAGAVGVGVGGNLVNKEWIARGEFDKITAHAKKLVQSIG